MAVVVHQRPPVRQPLALQPHRVPGRPQPHQVARAPAPRRSRAAAPRTAARSPQDRRGPASADQASSSASRPGPAGRAAGRSTPSPGDGIGGDHPGPDAGGSPRRPAARGTGRTDASGTSSPAPSPVQLTTTGASAHGSQSQIAHRADLHDTARRHQPLPQPRQMSRHVDERQPRLHSPDPPYSSAVATRSPGSRAAAHASASSRPVSPSTPSTMRTPLSPGRAASSSYTSRSAAPTTAPARPARCGTATTAHPLPPRWSARRAPRVPQPHPPAALGENDGRRQPDHPAADHDDFVIQFGLHTGTLAECPMPCAERSHPGNTHRMAAEYATFALAPGGARRRRPGRR